MRHSRWALALALAAGACVAPPSNSTRESATAQGSPTAPPRPRETVQRASGDVLVRLVNVGGEGKLEVRDAAGRSSWFTRVVSLTMVG